MRTNTGKRPRPPKGQLGLDLAVPPEWAVAQQALAASLATEPAIWAALAQCGALEAYTDGSAPLRNPGGEAGFAAVIVGFAAPLDPTQLVRPPPHARLDLGGYIAARTADPPTSNNRAEIAGVLAALAVFRELGAHGCQAAQIFVWSDSEYTVQCGNGVWQRKKNTDLWPILDELMSAVQHWAPGEVALQWLRGHAGNPYNEAADELATRAAFNFDPALYARYRAAQMTTGQEMPGARALAVQGITVAPPLPAPIPTPLAAPASPPDAPLAVTPLPEPAPAPLAATAPNLPELDPAGWLAGTDYTLALYTRLESGGETGPGRGIGAGRYWLWSRDGRSRIVPLTHAGEHTLVAAEYLTLIAALSDILDRITAAGRQPGAYTVTIYSHHELLVRQLTGAYRVKAPDLQAPFAAACDLLDRFKHADLIWKPAATIKTLWPE